MDDLSRTALALLCAINEGDDIDLSTLREYVPQRFDDADESWIDELQKLIDGGWVIRVAGDNRFLYRATKSGSLLLAAHIHPAMKAVL